MDPDANLKEQRRLCRRILDEPRTEWIDPADARQLAELAVALDQWLVGGGFWPLAWKTCIDRPAG